MNVVEFKTKDNQTRYMVLDGSGKPVEPILRFLKYYSSTKARNTLRSYSFSLKLYFEFLEQEGIDYVNAEIDDIAGFIRWLQNSQRDNKIITIYPVKKFHKSTLNLHITHVTMFYDYLMRHQNYSIQLSESLKTQILGSRRGYKDFLYHINRNKKFDKNILKQTVRRGAPKVLKDGDVEKLINSCPNLRDKFLIKLLWESGMRISEALALWLEDFDIGACQIHIRDRGELTNLAEIKTVCSPRTLDTTQDIMDMFSGYIAEFHTDEVDTNHVFILLSGENKCHPMNYSAIDSMFRRLRKTTGIHITPHMLRHTSLNNLRKLGWDIKKIQDRAGHASINSTMVYMHTDAEEMKEAFKQLSLIRKG